MRLSTIQSIVAAILWGLLLTSSASAQQHSLFGTNGPLSGPNGFGNLSSSPSFRERGAAHGFTIQTSPYPNRLFDRQRGSAFGASGLTSRAAGANAGIQIPGSTITERPLGLFRGGPGRSGGPSTSLGTERIAVGRNLRPPELDDNNSRAVDSGEPSEFDAVPLNGISSPRRMAPREFRAAGDAGSQGSATHSTTRVLSNQARLRRVTLTLNNGVWTLRGQVASEETRRLAAIYASLQPGIGSVRNEITVAPSPSSSPLP